MKKFILLSMLTLLASLFLSSCTEDSDEPYTKFKDYSTFTANREAWTELDDYSFTYNFRLGSTYMQSPVSVSVKNGKGTCSPEVEAAPVPEYLFESISEVYEYFENRWQKVKSEKNTNLRILFSVEYSKHGERVYPSTLKEHIEWCGSGDAPVGTGTGGVEIGITNFVVTAGDLF